MGKMIIITAPSGAGKTTIVRHLLKTFDDLAFSVSATTRPPRKGEVHGKDYYFLSEKKFKKKIKKEKFVEWEEVYPGKFYGTLKKEVKRLWKDDKHIVFDIEVKGATNIKNFYGDKALAVFVSPPSMKELMHRLEKRDTESITTIKVRMARAKLEMTYEKNFDKILVNDDLKVALQEAEQMIKEFVKKPAKKKKKKKKKKK